MEKSEEELKNWVTGFIDGVGEFSVTFVRRKRRKTQLEIRFLFMVTQKKKSLKPLEIVRRFLKSGGIRYNAREGEYIYELKEKKGLERLINHFNENKLLSRKRRDFERFKSIFEEVKKGNHLNKEGLEKIIKEAYKMTNKRKRKYTKEELLRLL